MAEKNENIHAGHRSRMIKKVQQHGFEGMEEHEILEVLLYMVIRRGNTNPTAHRLIKKFGSLKGVLNAETEELMMVEGVGEKSARHLKLLMRFEEYNRKLISKPQYLIPESEEAEEYLHNVFRGMNTEMLYMFCMDANYRLIAAEETENGSADAASINIQRLVKQVLKYDPQYVLLAHNHPSGKADYSKADEVAAQDISEALSVLKIEFKDHYVVTETEIKGIMTGYYAHK